MRTTPKHQPSTEEAVYRALVALRAKRLGLVSPSYAEIARHSGVAQSTVGAAMLALHKSGRVRALGGRRAWVPTDELAEARR